MIDWRLYLVTSGSGPEVIASAQAAARAGAGLIQVRCTSAPATELLALVLAVADAVHDTAPSTRVLVNDRVDVAHAARLRGAPVHGVHLGQDDLPVVDARAILGSNALIGLTAGTVEIVEEAQSRTGAARPDYLGSGPFRPTPTKNVGCTPIGLSGYPARVAATDLPVIAIGDVRRDDIGELARTGVAGVAVVREIMHAADPGAAATECLRAWDRGARSDC